MGLEGMLELQEMLDIKDTLEDAYHKSHMRKMEAQSKIPRR